jgi:DNA modification methylase
MKHFPLWKYSLDPAEVMMDSLKTQDLNISNERDGPVLMRSYPKDYLACDHISNHFTEYERIKCHFADKPSPLEAWKNILDESRDILNLDLLEQRECIYSATRECNTFNVSFCLWIINDLVGHNAKILDPSSGWGDRLIAAIASDASLYHGTDPNIKLQKGYNDIRKTFLDKESMPNFTVKKIPFEDMKVKTNYYDIALTSPPYFNLERYSDSKMQSINRYAKYEEWLIFYGDYLRKMVSSVKSGGFIVVYIEDIFSKGVSYKIREFTIKTMSDLRDSNEHVTYCKKYGLRIGTAQTRWALVWQKK